MASKNQNLSSYNPESVPNAQGMRFGIVCSEWNSNILQTIEKGEADNIPIVMLGTAFGCINCNNFKKTVLPNAKFKQWVDEHTQQTESHHRKMYPPVDRYGK